MNILISPTIKEPYEKQFEYSIDKKWISFLTNIFGDIKLIYPEQIKKKIDLVVLCGGNNLVNFKVNNSDLIRNKQDKKIFEYSTKKNIPLIGICYGAQFVAKILDCKIEKIKNHVGDHLVKATGKSTNLIKNNSKFRVNSYHNYGILKPSEKIIPLAVALDNSIELFKANNLNCLGIMWHPERSKKVSKIDKQIFLNFYNRI